MKHDSRCCARIVTVTRARKKKPSPQRQAAQDITRRPLTWRTRAPPSNGGGERELASIWRTMDDFEHQLTVQVKEVLSKCREVTETRGQPAFVDKAKEAVAKTRDFGNFLQRAQREELLPHAKVRPEPASSDLTLTCPESASQRGPADPCRKQHRRFYNRSRRELQDSGCGHPCVLSGC